MSSFLNSLEDKLRAMEEEIQTLPGELDSAVARLDRGELTSLLSRLNEDYNELSDKQFATRRAVAALGLPLIMQVGYPYIREITNEDLVKWRAAWKSDVRVVLSKDGVTVIAVSELARQYKMTVPEIILAAQQQGYIMLGWDQYKKLLDEIGKLIAGDEELLPGAIVGILVTTTDSPQEVKILPKILPFNLRQKLL